MLIATMYTLKAFNDILNLHSCDQTPYSLKVAIATALKRNPVYNMCLRVKIDVDQPGTSTRCVILHFHIKR